MLPKIFTLFLRIFLKMFSKGIPQSVWGVSLLALSTLMAQRVRVVCSQMMTPRSYQVFPNLIMKLQWIVTKINNQWCQTLFITSHNKARAHSQHPFPKTITTTTHHRQSRPFIRIIMFTLRTSKLAQSLPDFCRNKWVTKPLSNLNPLKFTISTPKTTTKWNWTIKI